MSAGTETAAGFVDVLRARAATNGDALAIDDGDNNQIRRNTVSGYKETGLELEGDSSGNVVSANWSGYARACSGPAPRAWLPLSTGWRT